MADWAGLEILAVLQPAATHRKTSVFSGVLEGVAAGKSGPTGVKGGGSVTFSVTPGAAGLAAPVRFPARLLAARKGHFAGCAFRVSLGLPALGSDQRRANSGLSENGLDRHFFN